jgi:hypothetical protein
MNEIVIDYLGDMVEGIDIQHLIFPERVKEANKAVQKYCRWFEKECATNEKFRESMNQIRYIAYHGNGRGYK